MDRFGPAVRRWRQAGKRRKSVRFLAASSSPSFLFFCFCLFVAVCGYQHCHVTVPLTMNQTLCAKSFITARHLGDESVASGRGSWAISKWTEQIIRTLTQRQAAVPITPIRNKRSIAPRTIKGFKNQNNVVQFSRKTKTKLNLASQPYTESFQEL